MCEQYTRFQPEYKCQMIIKTRQSIYECLAGFCFNNIFLRRHKFWLHRQFFLLRIQKRKWWVMVSFSATAAGLFWTVNVCWAHPVISRASAVAGSIFFMVLFPMLFEVRRIVCGKLKQTLNNELKFPLLLIFINVCQVRWIVIVFPD